MKKSEYALELFSNGFNCAQSVIGAWVPEEKRGEMLRIATAYGGGIVGSGALCGAACGALMAVGYEVGREKAEDAQAKDATYEKCTVFLEKFEKACGQQNCHNLLGCDPRTEEGKAHIEAQGLRVKVCEHAVRNAVEILEELL